jgi:hypothetical protein
MQSNERSRAESSSSSYAAGPHEGASATGATVSVTVAGSLSSRPSVAT